MYRKKLNRREDEMVSMVEDLFREIELYAEDEATKTRLLVLLCFMHGSFFCAVPSAPRKKRRVQGQSQREVSCFRVPYNAMGQTETFKIDELSLCCFSNVVYYISLLFLSFFSFPGMIMSLDFLLWSGSSSPSATSALEA